MKFKAPKSWTGVQALEVEKIWPYSANVLNFMKYSSLLPQQWEMNWMHKDDDNEAIYLSLWLRVGKAFGLVPI